MIEWKNYRVTKDNSIIETMKKIDETASQFALVVDQEDRLLGTVTDGDIRRGILKGLKLEEPVSTVMNPNPVTISENWSEQKIKKVFLNKKLRQIPVVNKEKRVINLLFSDRFSEYRSYDNWIVLMAGGLGTRLYPLTVDTPKPMLKVGSKPILETIVESFVDQGFEKFYLSVNYKREIIKDYFSNGSKWNVNVEYLDENEKLGTAGALSLFNEKPSKPIIVMNGDILTKVNYKQLLEFHEESDSIATMCVREYNYQIPYGVIKSDGAHLTAIEEKPNQKYFVNAGIYVLNPEVLDQIPGNTFFDMPTLFNMLLEQQKKTCVFPIREYWLDIGKMNDFEKANTEFTEVFS
jgi:dTDP-glucose pyrophosphorylase